MGNERWTESWNWAAGQPSMAPRSQLEYTRDEIWHRVRTLCDGIAKKVCNSKQNMWDTVQMTQAAHWATDPGGPQAIELQR